MTEYVQGTNFKPDPLRPNVCKRCREDFDQHYNGQCPVSEGNASEEPSDHAERAS